MLNIDDARLAQVFRRRPAMVCFRLLQDDLLLASASLSGLSFGTTYCWQVRALNRIGTTNANGGSTDFWSFTTKIWYMHYLPCINR